MSDRPKAPMVIATERLVKDWCGPVLLTHHLHAAVYMDDYVYKHDGRSSLEGALVYYGSSKPTVIFLDLRIPEARWRFCDVTWGSPAAEVVAMNTGSRSEPLVVSLHVGGKCVASSSHSVVVGHGNRRLYVPKLASLPDENTLAWAIWETSQVMGVRKLWMEDP